MSSTPEILRFAAFSTTADGGNPAGVVLDAAGLGAEQMQRIAAEVGYSETAFLAGDAGGEKPVPVRYFAPEGEVDFCGHATIATAVALGSRHGPGGYPLLTKVGLVEARVETDSGGRMTGALVSPPLATLPLDPTLLAPLLGAFGWTAADLRPDHPPVIGFGGNKHPVLVLRTLDLLEQMAYDFAALQAMCRQHDWITVQVCVPVAPGRWRARDPFPWGGVVEDPATGAAAAALVAYLRDAGRLADGASIVIEQGVEMGRPSVLHATLLGERAQIAGAATQIG